MNYRKANWGFLGMVLTHFAVIIALLIGRVTSMGMMTNLFLSEMMLVIPAFAALLFSREKPNRVLCFHGLKFSSVLMVVVFTFLMGPLTTLLNAISMLFVDNAVTDMSGQVLEYPFPVMLFMMAVFGPVCEELVFRGILYRGYLKSAEGGAVVFSSVRTDSHEFQSGTLCICAGRFHGAFDGGDGKPAGSRADAHGF